MKKIVIPFEGTNFRPELLDFVRALNQMSKVLLTAAFVPDLDYARVLTPAYAMESLLTVASAADEDKLIARHTAKLQRYCDTHDIALRLREDRFDFALAAIEKETVFSDLLLLNSQHFFENICADQPNAYLNEVLHHAACPVILLPDEARLPGEIVLAYDGSVGSIYAIRQFAYLFPEFSRLPTTLVYVDEKGNGVVPDQDLIRELGNVHFRNFRMLRLNMRTDNFNDSWIGMMNNPWLVAGAYGRSDWSRLFSHSFIDRLIKEHKVPLFIAHK